MPCERFFFASRLRSRVLWKSAQKGCFHPSRISIEFCIPTRLGGDEMSVWDERFLNHGVFKSLTDLETELQSAEVPSDDPDIIEARTRLDYVIGYVSKVIHEADPLLVTSRMLDPIREQLSHVLSNIQVFLRNPNSERGHLDSANSHADTLLESIRLLPLLSVSRDQSGHGSEKLQEQVAGFREKAGAFLRELKKERDQSKKEFQSLSEKVIQVSEAVGEQGRVIDEQKNRLDSALNGFAERSAQAESQRASTFNAATTKQGQEFSAHVKSLETRTEQSLTRSKQVMDEKVAELDGQAKSALVKLEEDRRKGTELVGLIANVGVTGKFKSIADSERWYANAFRWIGLLLMIIISILAAVMLYRVVTVDASVEWKFLAVKIFTIVTLLLPALYCTKEAEKHRQRERINRKFELELTAIDPYLESLPVEKRHALKEQLAVKFFAQPETVSTDDKDSVSVASIWDMLKQVLMILAKK